MFTLVGEIRGRSSSRTDQRWGEDRSQVYHPRWAMKRHENARTQHKERHEHDEKVAPRRRWCRGSAFSEVGRGLFGQFLTVLHLRGWVGRSLGRGRFVDSA